MGCQGLVVSRRWFVIQRNVNYFLLFWQLTAFTAH